MNDGQRVVIHTHHKEESQARIQNDNDDRCIIRSTLTMCIDPLNNASHPDDALLNIITGEVCPPDVNVDDALCIGKNQMTTFKSGWPTTFYDKLSKVVITMDSKKRHILVGQQKVYDQDFIYGRVLGMLVSSRDINFDDVLPCELTAYPPSMFSADGQMKISKSKSVLKKKLQVTISERNCSPFDTVIYDVSALLWVLSWPSPKVKLRIFVDTFKDYVKNALKLSNVICVFDCYFDNSIKTSARMQRAESSRVHNLLLDMPTPQKQVILSVTKNKVQLNAMLAEALLDSGFYAQAMSQNRLIIAGVTDAPVQITHDLKINRRDFSSSHEEADVIIAQLAVAMSLEDKSVRVVCDDTDVSVLLVHFYNRCA